MIFVIKKKSSYFLFFLLSNQIKKDKPKIINKKNKNK